MLSGALALLSEGLREAAASLFSPVAGETAMTDRTAAQTSADEALSGSENDTDGRAAPGTFWDF